MRSRSLNKKTAYRFDL